MKRSQSWMVFIALAVAVTFAFFAGVEHGETVAGKKYEPQLERLKTKIADLEEKNCSVSNLPVPDLPIYPPEPGIESFKSLNQKHPATEPIR